MLFSSWIFIAFAPLVLLLFHTVRNRTARLWLLLTASYVFYGWWNWKLLWLVAVSTMIDYISGIVIARAHARGDARAARRYVAVSMIANLGFLGFFKYAGFFASIVQPLVERWGLDAAGAAAQIILPLGISFYTFQSMSYTIDIYRREAQPVPLLVFATYIAYFPQLVAGPIERSTRLIPALLNPAPVRAGDVRDALGLLVLGYFKKIVCADVFASWADPIFSSQELAAHGGGPTVSAPLLWCALYLFIAQIYFDFSAYTDIARGISKLFGIDLMKNFEQPYLATTLTEFWKRWHISLSSWFRDYLYRPLREGKRTETRIRTALLLTMALAGFWHGANWTFIIWGTAFGVVIVGERIWNTKYRKRFGTMPDPLTWFATFNFIVLSLSLFRNHSLKTALGHYAGLLSNWSLPRTDLPTLWMTLWALAILFFVHLEQKRTKRDDFFMAYPIPLAGLACGAMLLATIYWSFRPGQPFIYFQF